MRKAARYATAALGLLAACGPAEPAPNPALRQTSYFNLTSFLRELSAQLSRRQPAVEKQVILLDGQQETTRVAKPDWTKELQIFQQADIDKPALRGQYLVDSAAMPGGGMRRTYRRRPGVSHPVEQLTIISQGSQVQQLRAVVAQDNPLVYSAKRLELNCQNGQLTTYRVRGVQKLILFDSVQYAVQGRVGY